jgi:hypothetical protein
MRWQFGKQWRGMVRAMIPMRTSSIFKSRWMALLWSAGIIWFAVDVAGTRSDNTDQNTAADNNMDQAIAALDSISSK